MRSAEILEDKRSAEAACQAHGGLRHAHDGDSEGGVKRLLPEDGSWSPAGLPGVRDAAGAHGRGAGAGLEAGRHGGELRGHDPRPGSKRGDDLAHRRARAAR